VNSARVQRIAEKLTESQTIFANDQSVRSASRSIVDEKIREKLAREIRVRDHVTARALQSQERTSARET